MCNTCAVCRAVLMLLLLALVQSEPPSGCRAERGSVGNERHGTAALVSCKTETAWRSEMKVVAEQQWANDPKGCKPT